LSQFWGKFYETFSEYPQVNMSTEGNWLNILCAVTKKHKNESDKIDQQLTDSAIKHWRKRLSACVSARGGHIEHHALKHKSKLINSLHKQ